MSVWNLTYTGLEENERTGYSEINPKKIIINDTEPELCPVPPAAIASCDVVWSVVIAAVQCSLSSLPAPTRHPLTEKRAT